MESDNAFSIDFDEAVNKLPAIFSSIVINKKFCVAIIIDFI